MKRERIEDLGAIRILIMEALDSSAFEDMYLLQNIEEPQLRYLFLYLSDLEIKLKQIQHYADGDQE